MNDCLDVQLITDYLAGDEKSLEILIKRYFKPIYSFVYRYIGKCSRGRGHNEQNRGQVYFSWNSLIRINNSNNYGRLRTGISKNSFVPIK